MKKARAKLFDSPHFMVRREKVERKPDARIDSQDHRTWVASLPCHACGEEVAEREAAHLRKFAGEPVAGKKKDDFWCWPGCYRCHEQIQHTIGEDSFWERRLRDMDRWRTVLERYGMKSPVLKVRLAAQEEWERRYGRT